MSRLLAQEEVSNCLTVTQYFSHTYPFRLNIIPLLVFVLSPHFVFTYFPYHIISFPHELSMVRSGSAYGDTRDENQMYVTVTTKSNVVNHCTTLASITTGLRHECKKTALPGEGQYTEVSILH